VLLLAAADSRLQGAMALVVFAAATACAMALLSLTFACVLGRRGIQRRLAELVPVFATAGLIFGVWYSVGAFRYLWLSE
jgi:arginine exporter protein ArgO